MHISNLEARKTRLDVCPTFLDWIRLCFVECFQYCCITCVAPTICFPDVQKSMVIDVPGDYYSTWFQGHHSLVWIDTRKFSHMYWCTQQSLLLNKVKYVCFWYNDEYMRTCVHCPGLLRVITEPITYRRKSLYSRMSFTREEEKYMSLKLHCLAWCQLPRGIELYLKRPVNSVQILNTEQFYSSNCQMMNWWSGY
jgi:hypothetical protein